jgi:hypothetical protein
MYIGLLKRSEERSDASPKKTKIKLGDSPANLLINQGVMATLQERRLGYHSRAGLEPGTSGFSTLRINHYAARGIPGNEKFKDTKY